MSSSTDKVPCDCSAKCIRVGLVSRRTYNRHAPRRAANQLQSFNAFQRTFEGGVAAEEDQSSEDEDVINVDETETGNLQEEGQGVGDKGFDFDHFGQGNPFQQDDLLHQESHIDDHNPGNENHGDHGHLGHDSSIGRASARNFSLST